MCYGFLLLLTVFNSLLWSVIVCYCLLLFVIVCHCCPCWICFFGVVSYLGIWVLSLNH